MSYRLSENGRQFVVIAAGGHGRMGTGIGDSVVAFALPESGTAVLAQTTARTLRVVGMVLILLLASYLVVRLSQKNWFWYGVLALFAAVAIAWLLTLTRKRLFAP